MDLLKKIKNFTYNQRHCLGEGSFGKVYQGKSDDGHKVAIKKVQQRLISQDAYLRASLETEINIMKKLHHPNIVYLQDVVQTSNSIYLVMQYCVGGDLKRYCRNRKLTEQQAQDIIKQICRGFQEIVKHGIIHRDLKPANILVHEGVFKICDFGFAKFFGEGKMARTCVGTPVYMSPQVLTQKHYTDKTDIWSLGVLYYQLIFSRLPYTGPNEEELYRNILKYPLNLSSCSKFTQNFLKGTLVADQNARWSWSKVFQALQLPNTNTNTIPQKKNQQLIFYKRLSTDNDIRQNNNKSPPIMRQQIPKNNIIRVDQIKQDSMEKSNKFNNKPLKPKPKNLLALQTNQQQIIQQDNPRFLYFIIVQFIVNPLQANNFKIFLASLYKYTLICYQRRIQKQQGLYRQVLISQLEELRALGNQIPKVKQTDPKKIGESVLLETQKNSLNFQTLGWIERFLQKQYKYTPIDSY